MPAISVIIPAYNAERWIGECLRSVFAQTFQDYEVIVVDDGSTDDTTRVVELFDDMRLRLIRQENLGASAARNVGIRHALGDFLQFFDADDLMSADKLAKQMSELVHAPIGAVASCAWGKFTSDPAGVRVHPEPVWEIVNPIEWIIDSLSGGGMMQPGAWLVPRIVIEKAGYWDESLGLDDDGEYFTRVLLECSRNIFVPGPIVYYREVSGSLSRSVGLEAMKSALAVCRSRHLRLLAAVDNIVARRAIATQYANFAYQFYRLAPNLTREAIVAIRELGVDPVPSVGGKCFRLMNRGFGFEFAWKLRKILQQAVR